MNSWKEWWGRAQSVRDVVRGRPHLLLLYPDLLPRYPGQEQLALLLPLGCWPGADRGAAAGTAGAGWSQDIYKESLALPVLCAVLPTLQCYAAAVKRVYHSKIDMLGMLGACKCAWGTKHAPVAPMSMVCELAKMGL